MRSNIVVSISCTTYNHAKYIRQCLDGFLMQKCNFGFEVLIHDDASTDGTQEIIKEYQEKYPDIIKPILREQNLYSRGERGFNSRFNFSRAKGKYIAMCEGDDYWIDPLKLQKQIAFLEANSDCSLCFTGCEIHKSTGEKKVIRYDIDHLIGSDEYLFKQYFMATASLCFRIGIDKAPREDWMATSFAGDFILRYKALTVGKIGYIDSVAVAYNKGTEGSWSRRKLNSDIVQKEYADNILGLQYLKKNVPNTSEKALKYREQQLKDNTLYKMSLSKGGWTGFLYLIARYNVRMNRYIGAYLKRLLYSRNHG